MAKHTARRSPKPAVNRPGKPAAKSAATSTASTQPRWWTIRPAHNRKPATYRCPLCGGQLPALMDHVLLKPEGDAERRRHAHSDCVMRARKQGGLPTREEYERAERERRRAAGELPPPWWRRLLGPGR